MKVVIVGGGIGGVATYLALRKHLADASPSVELVLLEAHPTISATTAAISGGIALPSNGLRAIAQIAPDAATYIRERGFLAEATTFRNSKGALLGRQRLGGAKHPCKRRPHWHSGGVLMVSRGAVHDALVRELRPREMTLGKRVRNVKEVGESVEITFEDGEVEYADLVIGADGPCSVVREGILGDRYAAKAASSRSVGGFVPISSLSDGFRASLQRDPVTTTFGSNGFFGYSPCSPDLNHPKSSTLMWWSSYEGGQSEPLSPETILSQLLERHASWRSVVDADAATATAFRELITTGCSSPDFYTLPTRVVPCLPRCTTPSGRVVLIGNAAHPDYGLGVASAAEDAVTLALLLKHYRVSHRFAVPEALRRTAAGFDAVRMKARRVGRIGVYRQDVGHVQSWWQEKVRDWSIWLRTKLPESLSDPQAGYDLETAIARYITKSGCDKELISR
uniref:FAD-binding protein n=1 Tax=Mycena chlorophos TaxID=658473 RepID=A0ABQ0LMW4_MYCCL|nr:FAD-binding protein [Mycena chlorophos]